MKKITVMAVAIAMCCAAQANAAHVIYRLYLGQFAQGAGTFKLTAELTDAGTGGASFGMASYGVELVGNTVQVAGGTILTVNHNSLRVGEAENAAAELGPVGFTTIRTNDDTTAAASAAYTVTGSQDTIAPTPHLIRGLGKETSSLAAKGLTPGGSTEGSPWGNAGVAGPGRSGPINPGEMTLAIGTYTPVPGGGVLPGVARGIDFLPTPTAATFANVFTEASGIVVAAVAPLEIERQVIVPEPATLALVGFGAMGLVAIARRRRS